MVLSSQFSTRFRVGLLLALVLLVYVGLNMAALGGVVFPAFAAFERDDAIRNIGRVAHAIRREQGFLENFSADWAHWDDTYAFVAEFDAAYRDGNLTDAATIATPTDLIGIWGSDGQPRALDVYHGLKPRREQVLQRMQPDGDWYRALVQPLLRADAEPDDHVRALLELDGQPLLGSAHAVLQSDREGPPRGVLVMIAALDRDRRQQIEQQTLVPFDMTFRATAMRSPAGAATFATFGGDPGLIEEQSGQRLRLTVPMPVATGGVFEVGSDYARQMTREGAFALGLALAISTVTFALLVGGLYYRLLARSFLQPLRSIVSELRRIEDGRDLAARLPVQGAAELQKLALSFNAMMVEVEAHRDEIALLSLTDPLTRVPNRRQFEQVLQREWQRAQRQREPLALLLCDIDCFKAYNDHYGHPAGDDCLRRVARAMHGATKRRTDLVARYGGEEFVIVLPDTGQRGALIAAERMLAAVRQLHLEHARSPVAARVTISIGAYAGVPTPDDHPDTWIAAADAALYRAKSEGRDRAVRGAIEGCRQQA